MVVNRKAIGKGKPPTSHSKNRSRSAKPSIMFGSDRSVRDRALKQLHLKSSDILSQATRGGNLVFVTKNGMKVTVKK